MRSGGFSEQLGHKDLTTTLRFYDEWVPKKGQAYADILGRKSLALRLRFPPFPNQIPNQDQSLEPRARVELATY